MHIEIRSTDRLRGPKALDPAPVLAQISEAARGGAIDLSRLRVVCDWVQYRQNFREPVTVRRIVPQALETARWRRSLSGEQSGNTGLVSAGDTAAYEIAIDLRRAQAGDLPLQLAHAFNGDTERGPDCRQFLEAWVPESTSCIWKFNALYWRALGLWEQATGREYEQALPSGESDARNLSAARELILELFRVWDDLAARRALPEDLHVLELGVGNGNQAKVWLDEFARLDRERGGEYYRRLHYLMGDYSPHVLERARQNVRSHADHVSALVLDATRPSATLSFLRYKAFLIYISNVYDNLPTDEIVRIGGHLFRVEVRAFIPGKAAAKLAADLGVSAAELPDLALRLVQLGPELLAEAASQRFSNGPLAAVVFWSAVWEALRLEERYMPIEELDTFEIAPGVGGETLRPIAEANGDVRMHVSNGAAASFVESLPLLHPYGVLQCHDLFVTDVHQYDSSFRGPGKYDGSVVNWVNGPLLTAIGQRRGFEVTFQQFAHRSGSNVTTLSARVRE